MSKTNIEQIKNEVLLKFISSQSTIGDNIWKILVEKGNCIVPKNSVTLRGGADNFIEENYNISSNYIECKELSFDKDNFISWSHFQDYLKTSIKNLEEEMNRKEIEIASMKRCVLE